MGSGFRLDLQAAVPRFSISRHIVDLHGGRIAVHSTGLGRGAAFTVRVRG